MTDDRWEEVRDALRSLSERLSAGAEFTHGEAQPLRLRRLDPRVKPSAGLADSFFMGPVRPPQGRWVQVLVAAGLSLTLAGSLVALPLVGRNGPTDRADEAAGPPLPTDIDAPTINVPAPPSTQPINELPNAA